MEKEIQEVTVSLSAAAETSVMNLHFKTLKLTALKIFLDGKDVFALLLTSLSKNLVKHSCTAASHRVVIGPLSCDRQKLCDKGFRTRSIVHAGLTFIFLFRLSDALLLYPHSPVSISPSPFLISLNVGGAFRFLL